MNKLLSCSILIVALAGVAHADDPAGDAKRALRNSAEMLASFPHVPPIAEDIATEGYDADAAPRYFSDYGGRCAKIVDDAIAAGVAADTPVEIAAQTMTIAAGKQAYCQGLIDYGNALQALFDGAAEEAKKAVYAKYEQYGVKGDRLELFVYYDNTGWFMKGCQYTVDEPADIAKAKVLFHWLDNADGSITIRKYRFKKNKYKVSEKTYWRADKAYRGCR